MTATDKLTRTMTEPLEDIDATLVSAKPAAAGRSPAPAMGDLVAGITDDNRHGEFPSQPSALDTFSHETHARHLSDAHEILKIILGTKAGKAANNMSLIGSGGSTGAFDIAFALAKAGLRVPTRSSQEPTNKGQIVQRILRVLNARTNPWTENEMAEAIADGVLGLQEPTEWVAPQPSAPTEAEPSPELIERAQAEGIDLALEQLCRFLGVDPEQVSWDAATETVAGDVSAIVGNILRAKYGEDFDTSATSPHHAEVGALRAEADAIRALGERRRNKRNGYIVLAAEIQRLETLAYGYGLNVTALALNRAKGAIGWEAAGKNERGHTDALGIRPGR